MGMAVRPMTDPAMLVAILLYAYCCGIRSSRVIERRCQEDVAFRVLAGGLLPDHVTFARFRSRHAEALAEVFVDSLRLCAEAGLVRLGAVALDGSKIGADARTDGNRTLGELNRLIEDMLDEAAAVDAAEDARDANDPPLPPGMVDRGGRLARLREAKARLQADAQAREARSRSAASRSTPPAQPRACRRGSCVHAGVMRRRARMPS